MKTECEGDEASSSRSVDEKEQEEEKEEEEKEKNEEEKKEKEQQEEEDKDEDKYESDLDLEADFPQGKHLLYTEFSTCQCSASEAVSVRKTHCHDVKAMSNNSSAVFGIDRD